MALKKRAGAGRDVEHHGRITVHHDQSSALPAAERDPTQRRRPSERTAEIPLTSSRYTPPRKFVRFRPSWHKTVGVIVVVLGLGLVLVDEAMRFGAPETLLPGGHSIVYFLLGIAIAGYSLWWFGWLDREQ